jgi:hypothetical protein
MLLNHRSLQGAVKDVGVAERETIGDFLEQRVSEEAKFLERFVTRVQDRIMSRQSHGVQWQAISLREHGPGAPEKQFGADVIGVFQASVPNYRVGKGFLAQGKMLEYDTSFDKEEFERLQEQCRRMLDISSHSYVFVCGKHGIRVVPALSIVSTRERNPWELHGRSVKGFYTEHFRSFIGDAAISVSDATAIQQLKDLKQRNNGRFLLAITARRNEPDEPALLTQQIKYGHAQLPQVQQAHRTPPRPVHRKLLH